MIELETGTVLWLLSAYCAVFVAWAKMAFKFRSLYDKKLSNYIFYTLLFSFFSSMAMYSFFTNYVTNLQNKLYKNSEAINTVLTLAESYNRFFYFTWLVISALFVAWVLIAFFLLSYEQHLRENNKK